MLKNSNFDSAVHTFDPFLMSFFNDLDSVVLPIPGRPIGTKKNLEISMYS